MTKDEILERIKQLKAERDQALANVHAYDGALLECEYWLKQLETKSVTNGDTPQG